MQKLNRLLLIIFLSPIIAAAGDLDDGIPLDDSIDDSNALQKGVNIPFILMKAKGKELTGSRVITSKDSAAGQGNIIIGPGANIAPGTVIINNSDNRGATAIAK